MRAGTASADGTESLLTSESGFRAPTGLAAPLPAVGSRVLLLCAVMVLLLRDLGVIRFWLPENHRQVPQSVLRKPGLQVPQSVLRKPGLQVPQSVLRKPGLQPAFQFGVELGTGVRTYVPSAAPYTAALTIVLLASAWPVAMTAAGGFALGRAATPATRLLSNDVEVWDMLLTRRLAWLAPCSQSSSGCALCRPAKTLVTSERRP